MKLFKKKDLVQLSEQAELELRERLTYLEEKVNAQHAVIMATTELVKFLIEHGGNQ